MGSVEESGGEGKDISTLEQQIRTSLEMEMEVGGWGLGMMQRELPMERSPS